MTKILRIKAVADACGISRSQIYLLMKEGKFPLPVKIVGKLVGWNSDEVQSWIDERLKGNSL